MNEAAYFTPRRVARPHARTARDTFRPVRKPCPQDMGRPATVSAQPEANGESWARAHCCNKNYPCLAPWLEYPEDIDGVQGGGEVHADVFPPVDVEQIADELRLVNRGNEDGERGQPQPNDEYETAAESDVRAEIERRAAKANRDYQTQLDLYEGRIRRALVSADLRTAIEAEGERALSDFKGQATDDLSRLDPLRREVFRATNRTRRVP